MLDQLGCATAGSDSGGPDTILTTSRCTAPDTYQPCSFVFSTCLHDPSRELRRDLLELQVEPCQGPSGRHWHTRQKRGIPASSMKLLLLNGALNAYLKHDRRFESFS